jgi:hypothetical protein
MKYNKTSSNYLYLLGAICAMLLLTACTLPGYTVIKNNTTIIPSNGRVVMTVTDAAALMGNITSVKMTVDKVALHSDADGWVDVATPQRTYDLIAIKASGNQVLLTDLSLAPARYDQIRLEVSGVIVTDANGTHDAKMPSSTLRLNGEIIIIADKTATASFDFIADKSLYTTGNGMYIFAPVIQLESRTDGNADATASDNVILSGGTLQTSSLVGMDVLGNLVIGGSLPPFLKINDDGTISGTQDALNMNTTNASN